MRLFPKLRTTVTLSAFVAYSKVTGQRYKNTSNLYKSGIALVNARQAYDLQVKGFSGYFKSLFFSSSIEYRARETLAERVDELQNMSWKGYPKSEK